MQNGRKNMLVAKFVDNNISYANFGTPIEEDILVLPINEYVDVNSIILEEKAILLEISEEDIVKCQGNRAFHVTKAIPVRELNSDELSILRTAACKNSELAYYYARDVDKNPTNETRTNACQNPEHAYYYAKDVDKKPTNETRTNAGQCPEWAYLYAKYVDKKPTDETRSAVSKNPSYAYWYAIDVDKKSTPETRNAASKDPYFKEQYAKWEKSIC
jgi:hypothetical protein